MVKLFQILLSDKRATESDETPESCEVNARGTGELEMAILRGDGETRAVRPPSH
jgi:hypothetical protein